jgi:short-subunit dehydrogenase
MRTVLITGGSGGLGYAMSTYFAHNNYLILWVSHSEEELQKSKDKLIREIPSSKIETLLVDLSKEEGAKQVYEWTKLNQWSIDVLINNAGFGTFGYFNRADFEKEKAMIQLNVLNLFNMTHLFLNQMMEKDKAVIINISSNSSFIPLPKMLTYSSTKAFVTHFSRGLREEVKQQKSKLRIITVCPAAISDTSFKTEGKMSNVKTFKGLATTTSLEVARDVWKAYTGKNDFIVSGRKMRFLYHFYPIIPYRILQWIANMELKES